MRIAAQMLALGLVTWCSASVGAGQFNDVLSIGDSAPAWESLPGTDGKPHSLSDLKDKSVIVVVFTCNSCPAAQEYEDRIVAFAKEHAKDDSPVAIVAINVNRITEDQLPAMKERAKAKGFTFPYLYDETQMIARKYGALRTPEFFVLNSDRRVVYMGKMDDNSVAGEVKTRFVADAVTAALAGSKPATGETVAEGCLIRYARERRKKGS